MVGRFVAKFVRLAVDHVVPLEAGTVLNAFRHQRLLHLALPKSRVRGEVTMRDANQIQDAIDAAMFQRALAEDRFYKLRDAADADSVIDQQIARDDLRSAQAVASALRWVPDETAGRPPRAIWPASVPFDERGARRGDDPPPRPP